MATNALTPQSGVDILTEAANRIINEKTAEVAQLWRTIGNLEQQLRNARGERERLEPATQRYRDALVRIVESSEQCSEGEDGTCGKCVFCLAYFGLWGSL